MNERDDTLTHNGVPIALANRGHNTFINANALVEVAGCAVPGVVGWGPAQRCEAPLPISGLSSALMRRRGDCFPKADPRATQAAHDTVRTGTARCNGCMTLDADVGRAVNVADALKRKLNVGNGDPLIGGLNAKRLFLPEECVAGE